jgi:putative transcriptional regulator
LSDHRTVRLFKQKTMNNRIKILRAEQDRSQQALADKIGVSRQALNALERWKHVPSS